MSDDDFVVIKNLGRVRQPLPAELFDVNLARAITLSAVKGVSSHQVKLSAFNTCIVLPPEEALADAADRAAQILSAQDTAGTFALNEPKYAPTVNSSLWRASRTGKYKEECFFFQSSSAI
jgi:hypothetical protein